MTKEKNPDVDLRLKYKKALEIGLAVSLFLHILLFQAFPNFDLGSKEIEAKEIEIVVEDIPPTEQIKRPPAPPRPSIPIPTENEDIPEDLTIETTELDLSDVPPPPPPPDEGDGLYDEYVFIPYDEAPSPIGGYAAIKQNLRYPEIAKKAGIQARVIIGVLVDENGNAVKTQVLKDSGYVLGFEEAAKNAIMTVKWRPAKQRDNPVKVWVSIPVNFMLENPKPAS